MQQRHYHPVAKYLHWIIAAMIKIEIVALPRDAASLALMKEMVCFQSESAVAVATEQIVPKAAKDTTTRPTFLSERQFIVNPSMRSRKRPFFWKKDSPIGRTGDA